MDTRRIEFTDVHRRRVGGGAVRSGYITSEDSRRRRRWFIRLHDSGTASAGYTNEPDLFKAPDVVARRGLVAEVDTLKRKVEEALK